ncbi:MAG: hypothetical protein SPJ92_09210, partial [Bariatricus sp.]|nr:hypothetical protein [Bariatricus sp.]
AIYIKKKFFRIIFCMEFMKVGFQVFAHFFHDRNISCFSALAFGYILLTAGRIRDFHPLETCAARRTTKKKRFPFPEIAFFSIYNMLA